MKISFDSYYDAKKDLFYLEASSCTGELDHQYHIVDSYDIELRLDKSTERYVAFEHTRMEAFANEKKLSKEKDLHVNGAGDLCVAPKNSPIYLRSSRNEQSFINYLLIPYLYSNSFFEKHFSRPWKDYGHNHIGYFESYKRNEASRSRELAIHTLNTIKGSWFLLSSLVDENKEETLQSLKGESEEAYLGAVLLTEDIERFDLGKFLRVRSTRLSNE